MLQRQQGHIFNICSIAGTQPYANGGSYSISKYAMVGFSKNLREELKPKGIKVTTVNPGATMSDSWSGSDIDPKRIMEAKDIADAIWAIYNLASQTVVEEIVMRPQLGDL
jgi:short-subunit dehydrogenase